MLCISRDFGEWRNCSKWFSRCSRKDEILHDKPHIGRPSPKKKKSSWILIKLARSLHTCLEYLLKPPLHAHDIKVMLKLNKWIPHVVWKGNWLHFWTCDCYCCHTTKKSRFCTKNWHLTKHGRHMIVGIENSIGLFLILFHWPPKWILFKEKISINLVAQRLHC